MFALTTKAKIITILSIEVSQANADELGNLLSAIEAIDGGAMVDPIESLVAQIESIQAIATSPASLKLSGMIQAKTVRWQQNGGAGVGTMQTLNQLKNQLRALLGIARTDAAAVGVSMIRSDRYSLTGWGSTYTDWRFLAW
jgi:hypothetical protein